MCRDAVATEKDVNELKVLIKKEKEKKTTICTKCSQLKRPTKAYVALLRSQNLPFICKSCREKELPPMELGCLGAL